jgi:hypothetical protein
MKILVQGGGDRVFHGSFYRMACEPRTSPLPESNRAAAGFARTVTQLTNSSPGSNACNSLLSKCCVFPVFPVGVLLFRRRLIYSA